MTSTGHWNPFIYTDADGMIDLTDRIPPASGFRILEIPYAINNAGQIVLTYGVLGAIRTYRLTPTTPDTEAPTIASVTATPNTLWPPDGTMKPISLAISVSDNRDANPSCTIASVLVTDGSTTVLAGSDVVITGDLSVSVRAVRSGGVGQDYKSALQELLQARELALPQYRLMATIGPDHQKQFQVEVSVGPIPWLVTVQETLIGSPLLMLVWGELAAITRSA